MDSFILIPAGYETSSFKIHKRINFISNCWNSCLSSGKDLLFYLFTSRAMRLTVVFILDITAINFIKDFIEYPSLKVMLICR
jgi:hypothetical protein